MAERTVATDSLIKRLCAEQYMTEEQLLVFLAIEYGSDMLSEAGEHYVMQRSAQYHRLGIYTVDV